MNMIVKRVKGKEYLISDMMGTSLSKVKFEKLKELNPELLGDYVFLPKSEICSSWWAKTTKKLTSTKIVHTYFDCDLWGKVTEIR